MPKKEDKKVKKTTTKKTAKKVNQKVATKKKTSSAKKTSTKNTSSSKKQTVKSTSKSNNKTIKKVATSKKVAKSKPVKKVVRKKKEIIEDIGNNNYNTVLDSNNTFPTDAIYETLLKEDFENEVRVSNELDRPINRQARKGIAFTVIAIIVILAILYFIVSNLITIVKNSGTISYHLSDITSINIQTDATINIPSTWTLTTDGKAYETNTNEVKMVIYSDKITPSQFEKMISSLNATFVSTGKETNQVLLYYIDNIYNADVNESEIDYFLHYYDGVLTEFVFSGCEYKTERKIVESIK